MDDFDELVDALDPGPDALKISTDHFDERLRTHDGAIKSTLMNQAHLPHGAQGPAQGCGRARRPRPHTPLLPDPPPPRRRTLPARQWDSASHTRCRTLGLLRPDVPGEARTLNTKRLLPASVQCVDRKCMTVESQTTPLEANALERRWCRYFAENVTTELGAGISPCRPSASFVGNARQGLPASKSLKSG